MPTLNDHDDLPNLHRYQDALIADLTRIAARDRWGRALILMGWIHLAFFGLCQLIYDPNVHGDPRHVILWVLEVATVVGMLRALLGPGWMRATPLGGVIVRVWGTFFILAFNLATINSLTGWDLNWFKLAWATLSTFGFATMAWLVNPWFLVPAVQMYVTGLLMVRFPALIYLIYGASWWAALQGIGLILERRRLQGLRAESFQAEPVFEAEAEAEPEPIGVGF